MSKQTRVYTMWCNMKSRCNNQNGKDYVLYGGRGIKLCDEWENSSASFIKWAKNNGYSDTLTIERIDVNVGYNPNNCTFISNEDQALNRRMKRDNTSGHTGISMQRGKFRLRLTRDKKRVFIGDYKTIEEAVAAKQVFCETNKHRRIIKHD